MKIKRRTDIILIIFLIIVSIILIYFKFFSNKILIQPFGYSVLIVCSGSMNPNIKTGNIIIIKKTEKYQVDDVVTFSKNAKKLITHRIIDKCENEFITKGDNNNVQDDEKVKENEIYGKVIFIF